MAEKPYQFRVKIPKGYSAEERQAIASEVVSFVRQRTLRGRDADGQAFRKYTKGYMKSVDFRAAGKTKKVNLTLSGEMLSNMDLVSDKPGELVIGYEDGSDQAGKAEGNQIGSYGRSPDPSKARNFLGISKEDLQKILDQYPLDNPEKSAERTQAIEEAQKEIDRFENQVQEGADEPDPNELAKKYKLVIGRT